MAIEKSNSELSPELTVRLEKLAQFISEESVKSDSAANNSNWKIYYHYNREFNAIAQEIGYDLSTEGNEDWTSVDLINKQISSWEGYEGKSTDWLQKCRRILRVACEIKEKSVGDNGLDEIDLKDFVYEHCRLIASCKLPLAEKKELWSWMESERLSSREIRKEISRRNQLHTHLNKAESDPKEESGEKPQLLGKGLDKGDLEAIATEIISKVQSGEIVESEKLIAELALRVRR